MGTDAKNTRYTDCSDIRLFESFKSVLLLYDTVVPGCG